MFYDEIADLFLKRLVELRMQKGVSAREMSLEIGQNENYLNAIENKRSLPSMGAFFYICEYLNLTPADFFDVENERTLEKGEIYSLIDRLNDNEVDIIISLLRALAEKEDKK